MPTAMRGCGRREALAAAAQRQVCRTPHHWVDCRSRARCLLPLLQLLQQLLRTWAHMGTWAQAVAGRCLRRGARSRLGAMCGLAIGDALHVGGGRCCCRAGAVPARGCLCAARGRHRRVPSLPACSLDLACTVDITTIPCGAMACGPWGAPRSP